MCYDSNLSCALLICKKKASSHIIGRLLADTVHSLQPSYTAVLQVKAMLSCNAFFPHETRTHSPQIHSAELCIYHRESKAGYLVKSSSSSLFCLRALGVAMLAQLGRDCSKRLMSSSLDQDALMVSFSSDWTIPLHADGCKQTNVWPDPMMGRHTKTSREGSTRK